MELVLGDDWFAGEPHPLPLVASIHGNITGRSRQFLCTSPKVLRAERDSTADTSIDLSDQRLLSRPELSATTAIAVP